MTDYSKTIEIKEKTSVPRKPVTENPVPRKPVTENPVTRNPVTRKPVTENPVTREPVTENPVTRNPVTLYKSPATLYKSPVPEQTSPTSPYKRCELWLTNSNNDKTREKPRLFFPEDWEDAEDSCLQSPVTPDAKPPDSALELGGRMGAGDDNLIPGISPTMKDEEDAQKRVNNEWKFQNDFEEHCIINNDHSVNKCREINPLSKSERLFTEMNDALERIALSRKQQQCTRRCYDTVRSQASGDVTELVKARLVGRQTPFCDFAESNSFRLGKELGTVQSCKRNYPLGKHIVELPLPQGNLRRLLEAVEITASPKLGDSSPSLSVPVADNTVVWQNQTQIAAMSVPGDLSPGKEGSHQPVEALPLDDLGQKSLSSTAETASVDNTTKSRHEEPGSEKPGYGDSGSEISGSRNPGSDLTTTVEDPVMPLLEVLTPGASGRSTPAAELQEAGVLMDDCLYDDIPTLQPPGKVPVLLPCLNLANAETYQQVMPVITEMIVADIPEKQVTMDAPTASSSASTYQTVSTSASHESLASTVSRSASGFSSETVTGDEDMDIGDLADLADVTTTEITVEEEALLDDPSGKESEGLDQAGLLRMALTSVGPDVYESLLKDCDEITMPDDFFIPEPLPPVAVPIVGPSKEKREGREPTRKKQKTNGDGVAPVGSRQTVLSDEENKRANPSWPKGKGRGRGRPPSVSRSNSAGSSSSVGSQARDRANSGGARSGPPKSTIVVAFGTSVPRRPQDRVSEVVKKPEVAGDHSAHEARLQAMEVDRLKKKKAASGKRRQRKKKRDASVIRQEEEEKAAKLVAFEQNAALAKKGVVDPMFKPSVKERRMTSLAAADEVERSKVPFAVGYERNPGGVHMMGVMPGTEDHDDYPSPENEDLGKTLGPTRRRPECAVRGNSRGKLIHFVEVLEARIEGRLIGEFPKVQIVVPQVSKNGCFSLRCIRGLGNAPSFEKTPAAIEAAGETWSELPEKSFQWSQARTPTEERAAHVKTVRMRLSAILTIQEGYPCPCQKDVNMKDYREGSIIGHVRTCHQLFRINLCCPVCGQNLGPELRGDRAMKHLRGHDANFDAVPPWEYPIHSIERNAEYTDLAVCLNPTHVSAIMEKCLVTAVGWPTVHNGLMLLWEMGIHRQINANVANMDDLLVPEKYAKDLGRVLASNLMKGVPVIHGRHFQVPSNNCVIRRTVTEAPAEGRTTLGELFEDLFKANLTAFVRSPLRQTFANRHRKFTKSEVATKLAWKGTQTSDKESDTAGEHSSQDVSSGAETSDTGPDSSDSDTEDYDPQVDDPSITRGTSDTRRVVDDGDRGLNEVLLVNRMVATTGGVPTPEEKWEQELMDVEVTPPRAKPVEKKIEGSRGILGVSLTRITSGELTRRLAVITAMPPSTSSPLQVKEERQIPIKTTNQPRPRQIQTIHQAEIVISDDEDDRMEQGSPPAREKTGPVEIRRDIVQPPPVAGGSRPKFGELVNSALTFERPDLRPKHDHAAAIMHELAQGVATQKDIADRHTVLLAEYSALLTNLPNVVELQTTIIDLRKKARGTTNELAATQAAKADLETTVVRLRTNEAARIEALQEQREALNVQTARTLDAEARSHSAEVEAARLSAQLDEARGNIEKYVEDGQTFHDDLELRLQGCFRRVVHLSTKQTLYQRHAKGITDCECFNCAVTVSSSEVMEQGTEKSAPFESEIEAVKTLEASLRKGKTEVPFLKVESAAAYTPADLVTSKRRLEATRDGPGLWAMASLASRGRYIQPPLRAKALVAARFGRARPAAAPTATATRPATLAVQPARELPGALAAADDVKPHLEELRKCLGVILKDT